MNEPILTIIFWLCFGATVYTYFLYPLLLCFLTRLLSPKNLNDSGKSPQPEEVLQRMPTDADLPAVTMVISAFNEKDILPDKISNCQALDYPPEKLTFLIGSDGSTDGTA
ncbi:MAG: hypothetical protein DRN95_08025, partial [Candidatus Hydrothermarchaeota archaeon]